MAFLSKGKLDFFKTRRDLSNKKISEATKLPISTVEKIFSGTTENPNIDTITRIVDVLGCTIEEILENDENISPYYNEKEIVSIAKKIYETQALKEIFDRLKQFNPDDINLINSITTRLAE